MRSQMHMSPGMAAAETLWWQHATESKPGLRRQHTLSPQNAVLQVRELPPMRPPVYACSGWPGAGFTACAAACAACRRSTLEVASASCARLTRSTWRTLARQTLAMSVRVRRDRAALPARENRAMQALSHCMTSTAATSEIGHKH